MTEYWKIKFNHLNCNHMHLGKDQPVVTYYTNNNGETTEIKNVTEQKDVGILIDNKLKFVPLVHVYHTVNILFTIYTNFYIFDFNSV